MKMVRVVGKVRWLYLIDVCHHLYKAKNGQDCRRIMKDMPLLYKEVFKQHDICLPNLIERRSKLHAKLFRVIAVYAFRQVCLW